MKSWVIFFISKQTFAASAVRPATSSCGGAFLQRSFSTKYRFSDTGQDLLLLLLLHHHWCGRDPKAPLNKELSWKRSVCVMSFVGVVVVAESERTQLCVCVTHTHVRMPSECVLRFWRNTCVCVWRLFGRSFLINAAALGFLLLSPSTAQRPPNTSASPSAHPPPPPRYATCARRSGERMRILKYYCPFLLRSLLNNTFCSQHW